MRVQRRATLGPDDDFDHSHGAAGLPRVSLDDDGVSGRCLQGNAFSRLHGKRRGWSVHVLPSLDESMAWNCASCNESTVNPDLQSGVSRKRWACCLESASQGVSHPGFVDQHR